MSRTVNLVLRVDSEGYELAQKRMEKMRAEGPALEQAMKRVADTSASASGKSADAAEKAAKRKAEADEKAAKRSADAAEKQYEREFAALVKKEEREAASAAKAADRKKDAADKAANAAKAAYEREFAALVKKEARDKDAAEKTAKRKIDAANKSAQRESELWNDQIQKAKARYEREAEAAEKAAKRKAEISQRAAKREDEIWNNQIQRAKARAEREGWGKDGVLPIRPSLQRIEAKINEPSGGMLAGIGGGQLAAAAGGFLTLASAKAALDKVIDETKQYDSLIARLSGVAGSTEKAREQFDRLEEISDRTIFSENEIAEAFIRMDQMGLKPTERSMKAFANIASATGSSMEDLAEASLQASLGTFRSLRAFGVKAQQEGDNIKLTFRGVTTTVANSTEAITNYLVKLGEVQFAGAAERQLNTMGGAVKQLSDAWGDLFREVGRGPVGDWIKSGMQAATSAVNSLSKALSDPTFVDGLKNAATFGAAGSIGKAFGRFFPKQSMITDADMPVDVEKPGGMSVAPSVLETHKKEIDELTKHFRTRRQVLEDAYRDQVALIDKIAKVDPARAEAMHKSAILELETGIKGLAPKGTKSGERKDADLEAETFFAKYTAQLRDERAKEQAKRDEDREREYQSVKDSLTREEDKTEASYKKRAEILQRYTTVEAAQYLLENESLWDKHNAELAEKERKAEAEKAKLRAGLMPGSTNPFDQLRNEEAERLQVIEDARLTDLEHAREYEAAKFAVQAEYSRKADELAAQHVLQSTQNAEALFGSLGAAARNWGGEQSASYRAMYAAQKAFAVASVTTSMAVGMGKAMDLGWPAGIPAGIAVAAEGAKILAIISGSNYSGAYDAGGNIPAGKVGLVGERRLEMIDRPTMVRGPARVVGGAETASMMGGGGSSGGGVAVFNMWDDESKNRAFESWARSGSGQRTIMNVVRMNESTMRTF